MEMGKCGDNHVAHQNAIPYNDILCLDDSAEAPLRFPLSVESNGIVFAKSPSLDENHLMDGIKIDFKDLDLTLFSMLIYIYIPKRNEHQLPVMGRIVPPLRHF